MSARTRTLSQALIAAVVSIAAALLTALPAIAAPPTNAAPPATLAAGGGSTSDPNLTFVGRWDTRSTAAYASNWAGAYVKVGFTGTTVKLRQRNTVDFWASRLAPIIAAEIDPSTTD